MVLDPSSMDVVLILLNILHCDTVAHITVRPHRECVALTLPETQDRITWLQPLQFNYSMLKFANYNEVHMTFVFNKEVLHVIPLKCPVSYDNVRE